MSKSFTNVVSERFKNILVQSGVDSEKIDAIATELVNEFSIIDENNSTIGFFVEDKKDMATAPGLIDHFQVAEIGIFSHREFRPEKCQECRKDNENSALPVYDEENLSVSCPNCGEVWNVEPPTNQI